MHVPLERRLTLDLGISVRRTKTELDSGSFIAIVKPFGVGTFRQVGARAGLTFDSRDIAAERKARHLRVAARPRSIRMPGAPRERSASCAVRWRPT